MTTTKLARQTRGTGEMHYLNTSYIVIIPELLVLSFVQFWFWTIIIASIITSGFVFLKKKLLVKLVTLVLDTVSYNKIEIRVLTSGKFMIHDQ